MHLQKQRAVVVEVDDLLLFLLLLWLFGGLVRIVGANLCIDRLGGFLVVGELKDGAELGSRQSV